MFYEICIFVAAFVLLAILTTWTVDLTTWILWKASDFCHKEKHKDEEN